MRSRGRPATVLVALGAAAMVASAGGLAAYGQAEPGSGFAAFALSANAPGAQVIEDNDNASTHPEGESDVPQALATLSSGPIGYALASIAWPGATVGNVGTLLIVASNGQAPDQVKALNDPVRAEARNGDGTVTNRSYPGTTMSATVAGDATAAEGRLDGANAAGVYSVGAGDASSAARLSGASSALATATTRLHDISLAGGAVHIASLTSTATATTDGGHGAGHSSTAVTGMTVGGVPVRVDGSGVHVASESVGVPGQATDVVHQTLQRLGMTIAFSDSTATKSAGYVDYTAGSLVIIWKPPPSPGSQDTHETITVLLGGTTVSAHATKGGSDGAPADGSTGQVAAPGTGTAGGAAAPPPAVTSADVPVGSTRRAQSPNVASLAARPATETGPSVPGNLPVSWVVLGVFGAVAFGLGVLRRLPTAGAAITGTCPREGSQ